MKTSVLARPELSNAVGFLGVMLKSFIGPRRLLKALASRSRPPNWYKCKYPNSLGGMYEPGPGVSGFGTFLEVLLLSFMIFAVP